MPIAIPSKLVEFILLGPDDDRRQLQDSPILGDVWIEYGKAPDKPCDLLITPMKTQHAGLVAAEIDKGLSEANTDANVAYLQGLVVATLTFNELVRVVVPKTKWWIDKWKPVPADTSAAAAAAPASVEFKHEIQLRYSGERPAADLPRTLRAIIQSASALLPKPPAPGSDSKAGPKPAPATTPFDRFATLTGLILWAGTASSPFEGRTATSEDLIKYILAQMESPDEVQKITDTLYDLANTMLADTAWRDLDGRKPEPLVWQISANRPALPALARSIPAVKADAATTLFNVDCSKIGWAVLDGGIDGTHPAFMNPAGVCRVKQSFDFANFRQIVSLRNTRGHIRDANVQELMTNKKLLKPPADPDDNLRRLAEDAINRGPIHWELVQPFVEIRPETTPATNHGTHVAGIIGANKDAARRAGKNIDDAQAATIGIADGMCPDISLYDFRVLGNSLAETEFAIIAALQFIRHINDRDDFFTIHGANLSLSIRHDVRNYACGRTPICDECERLINSGIVVVAAAGNHGYKSFETKDGAYESYTAFSITDPGNADGVITVGSTHRNWPHTYGVSFFSSRGPTGDGRSKPDLVAPGERIRAPFPNGEWGDLDGTSMAAPHVSGAAAMLMARYSELIGQPRQIKKILCDTATDLGRERSFQGHGMLDILRALQSV